MMAQGGDVDAVGLRRLKDSCPACASTVRPLMVMFKQAIESSASFRSFHVSFCCKHPGFRSCDTHHV